MPTQREDISCMMLCNTCPCSCMHDDHLLWPWKRPRGARGINLDDQQPNVPAHNNHLVASSSLASVSGFILSLPLGVKSRFLSTPSCGVDMFKGSAFRIIRSLTERMNDLALEFFHEDLKILASTSHSASYPSNSQSCIAVKVFN
jgi:hypothetical protein